MYRFSFLKSALAIGLSVMMALPPQLWAQDRVPAPQAADTTEGVPVVLEQVESADGSVAGWIAVAPVPEEDESRLIEALAPQAERTVLAVSGEQDPVVQAARKTGRWRAFKTYVLDKVSNAPIFSSEKAPAPSIKDRIINRIHKVSEYAQRERFGLLWAFFNASAISGITVYASSSVPAGLAVLPVLLTWNSVLMTTNVWDRMLEKSGDKILGIAQTAMSLFGQKIDKVESHVANVIGRFHLSLAANTLIGSYVLFQSGHLDSIWQAMWYGFLINYNVWDASFLKRLKEEGFRKRYYTFQFLLGTVFEAGSYLNISYTQMTLFSATTGGLLFLAFGHHIESTMRSMFQGFKFWSEAKVNGIRNRLERVRRYFRAKDKLCEDALTENSDQSIRVTQKGPNIRLVSGEDGR
jgi:hypothetical protein